MALEEDIDDGMSDYDSQLDQNNGNLLGSPSLRLHDVMIVKSDDDENPYGYNIILNKK